MKKSILLIIGLVFLNACAEYSALVGPSYTLAKSGSIVQTGNVYATSYVVKKATGQSPGEFVISLAKKRDYVRKEKARPHRLHFGRRLDVGGEIIDIRKPINTIICSYAHCPRFFVPLKNKNGNYLRCLLPDELKQIQGFPKDYKISGDIGKKIKQIGNAVPPPLIKMIIDLLKIPPKA